MGTGEKMKASDRKAERKRLSLEVAEIVHVCAARLVEQVVDTICESHVAPMKKALRDLQGAANELFHGDKCEGIGKADSLCTCGLVAFQNKFEDAIRSLTQDPARDV